MTVEELAERGARAAALVFVDSAGVARMKCVPLARLADAAERGIGLSVVFAGVQANDAFAPVPGIKGPTGDLRLRADLEAAAVLPCSPGWAWVPVDQYDQEGRLWPACQRSFLRSMVERARERGLDLQAGYELEWAVGRDGPGGYEPGHDGPGYGAATFGAIGDQMLAVVDALAEAGLEVAQIHPEYGVGQVELSLAPRDPLRACDESVFARHVIRTVAEQAGWRASFSPAVVLGGVGNGAHLHVSVWREGGSLLTGGLRPEGEAFLAGALEHVDALTALAAPSPVSAFRLKPSCWAGAFACWGVENREAALRLASPTALSANVEWKSLDGAANPYLALGGLIAAGLDGIERGLRLPAPVVLDPATMPEQERPRRLPETLTAATDAFAASELLRTAMGDFLHGSIVATRRAEVAFATALSDEELVAFHRWRY